MKKGRAVMKCPMFQFRVSIKLPRLAVIEGTGYAHGCTETAAYGILTDIIIGRITDMINGERVGLTAQNFGRMTNRKIIVNIEHCGQLAEPHTLTEDTFVHKDEMWKNVF